MVTQLNASSGYIRDDLTYDHLRYEIVRSYLKHGCGNAIVGGLQELMNQSRPKGR